MNKLKIIIFLLVSILSLCSHSQVSKGDFAIGFEGYHYDYYRETFSNNHNTTNLSSWGINAGYMFSDRFKVSLGYGSIIMETKFIERENLEKIRGRYKSISMSFYSDMYGKFNIGVQPQYLWASSIYSASGVNVAPYSGRTIYEQIEISFPISYFPTNHLMISYTPFSISSYQFGPITGVLSQESQSGIFARVFSLNISANAYF